MNEKCETCFCLKLEGNGKAFFCPVKGKNIERLEEYCEEYVPDVFDPDEPKSKSNSQKRSEIIKKINILKKELLELIRKGE